MSALDVKREMLRHMVATVAYRGGLAITDAPPDFAAFRAHDTTRTPGELLAHIGDLLEGSHYLLKGEFVYLTSEPLPWNEGVARFFSAVDKDLYNYPLTVKTYVPDDWTQVALRSADATEKSESKDLVLKPASDEKGKYVMYPIVPHTSVILAGA